MNELKIEKGIPIPGRKNGKINQFDIIRELEVNDSVAFPFEKEHTIYSHLTNFAKLFGVKFTGRALIENGIKVLRVWRVK